jgi:tetratricopeptide (TPR) repeat protein
VDAKRPVGLYVLAVLNIGLLVAALVLIVGGFGRAGGGAVGAAKEREVAAALAGRGLYREAADSYEAYLAGARIADDERANVLYTVAGLYMDKLGDYAGALARLERIKTLYPNAPTIGDVNRRTVECLERLGKTLDAQNALDQATRPDAAAPTGGTVLARVGDREITDRDLADEIEALPPQVRERVTTPEAKKELLHGIVQRELMVAAAVRRGLDKDPEVLSEAEKARRGILAGRVFKEEVIDKMEISPGVVADYLRQHPQEFQDKDGTPLAQDQAMRLAQQKVGMQEQERLSRKLVESLMTAQKAEVFEDRVK